MLNDTFAVRYDRRVLVHGVSPPDPAFSKVFRQAFSIIGQDLMLQLHLPEPFFQKIHDQVGRELGKPLLGPERNVAKRVLARLSEGYSVHNGWHGSADEFVKERLSLIEMTLRCAEELQVRQQSSRARLPSTQRNPSKVQKVVFAAIEEMNVRFRQAGLPLHYHNGLIQFTTEDQLQDEIVSRTWDLLRDPLWSNVEHELQVARDHADNGRGRDAARNAGNALESTIKIVSAERGWTRGTERGAAHYIDNLVSQKNGRFIDPWEAVLLKAFFTQVRNDVGHGPGREPITVLSSEQADLILNVAMTWIKTLVRRF